MVPDGSFQKSGALIYRPHIILGSYHKGTHKKTFIGHSNSQDLAAELEHQARFRHRPPLWESRSLCVYMYVYVYIYIYIYLSRITYIYIYLRTSYPVSLLFEIDSVYSAAFFAPKRITWATVLRVLSLNTFTQQSAAETTRRKQNDRSQCISSCCAETGCFCNRGAGDMNHAQHSLHGAKYPFHKDPI